MLLNGFTATHKKLLALLEDGMSHSDNEIRTALGDPEMEYKTITMHVSALRKKLGVYGQDIVRREGRYQIVRYTRSATRE